MTRAEAIKQIESLFEHCEAMMTSDEPVWSQDCEALKVALSALKGPTREQVEKVWKGEWKCQSDCGVTECTACKWNIEEYCGDYNFCPHCGAPMNDEAIQMVMERLEEMYK